MNILDWIGYVFGYVIYFGYQLTGAYVIGLILFTIVVKVVMLPMSLNQQRTSAKQARIQPKLRELQEMYRNNPTKYQEEQQALYARENISMMGGCLPMLIQFPVILGLYRAIVNPLTNVLHLSVDKVSKLMEFGGEALKNNYYAQSEIINMFPNIRDQVEAAGIFTAGELAKLDKLSDGAFFPVWPEPAGNAQLVFHPAADSGMLLHQLHGNDAVYHARQCGGCSERLLQVDDAGDDVGSDHVAGIFCARCRGPVLDHSESGGYGRACAAEQVLQRRHYGSR
jgi:YidC/Oxa1 family membrane protein insertase